MFFGTKWDLLILVGIAISMWASFRVRGTFNKWSEVRVSSGMTGAEAARRMLDANGLYDVPVKPVPGSLSDHYDPIKRVVNLSEPVYGESSISAISVACHEVGHAIQHKVHYPALVLRHRMVPVANLASGAAPFLILGGVLLRFADLIGIGILLFSAAVAFQLVTLPVEFNASSRARKIMVQQGFVTTQEEKGAGKVLNAAALTYVAATLVALMELLRFVMIFLDRRD
ncbi:MAG TPA: zinc metallopeptidase [Bacilli bacterium]